MRYCEKLPSVKNHKKRELKCLPNEKIYGLKNKFYAWKSRRKYGYAASECYDLDYTSCVWLYEHLNILLEVDIVDWEDRNWASSRTRIELSKEGLYEEGYPTLKSIITYIIDLLYRADKINNEKYKDEEAVRLRQKAFRVYAIILPYCWW